MEGIVYYIKNMKRIVIVFLGLLALTTIGAVVVSANYPNRATDEEFKILGEDDPAESPEILLSVEQQFANWKRPEGPLRVGLQVGHWKNKELPDELSNLRERGGGTSGGGRAEWEVNLAIAEETKKLLEPYGVVVDLIPATVPPDYLADLLIAIHADGSTDPNVSGFKVASPRRDLTRTGAKLVEIFEREYGNATQLRLDPNVTRNMSGYNAFNWRRYEHSMHPMTPAIIVETGFLTNPLDQRILIHNPARSAQGILNAVVDFLNITTPNSASV